MITLNTLISILTHNRANSKGKYLLSSIHHKNTIIRKLKQFNEKRFLYKVCIDRNPIKQCWLIEIEYNTNCLKERRSDALKEMIKNNPDSFLAKLYKAKQEGTSDEFLKEAIKNQSKQWIKDKC